MIFFSFPFFFLFKAIHTCGIWRFPGYGSNRSYSCWSTPQPQQRQIWAASVTYTTAHSNAGSLTHWMRPGIEPASSWTLHRFLPTKPQQNSLETLSELASWAPHGPSPPPDAGTISCQCPLLMPPSLLVSEGPGALVAAMSTLRALNAIDMLTAPRVALQPSPWPWTPDFQLLLPSPHFSSDF